MVALNLRDGGLISPCTWPYRAGIYSQQIDSLEYNDPHYNRKYQDLQEHQNKIYDEIAQVEENIADT